MDDSSTRRTALIAVSIMSFLTAFMGSGMNIALPSIGREFSTDALLLSWLVTAYSLAAAVFLMPFGKLSDIYGRKRIFLIGTVLYTVACLLCALASSSVTLLLSRIVQGISGAMLFSTSTAILTSVYPPQERGKALGINTATVYTGLSMGPFLGGLLVSLWGWRSIFWTSVPLGLVTLVYSSQKLKGEWAGSPNEPFDLRGSAVYAVAVVALMLGFSKLPALGGVWLILGGLVTGVLFIGLEVRTQRPILETSLFRGHRVFTLSSIAALASYAATSSVTFLLSLYLQYIKALTPQQAGLVLVAQPLMQAIFSPMAGRLSDRMQARIVASAGMALNVVGLVMLSFLGNQTSLVYVVICLLLLGFGFALFSSPNVSAIMGAAEKRYYGMASSVVATMRTFGQMLSLGIAMILFGLYIGQVQITPEHYPAFLQSARTAFVISAILCFGGMFASLARGEHTIHQENK